MVSKKSSFLILSTFPCVSSFLCLPGPWVHHKLTSLYFTPVPTSHSSYCQRQSQTVPPPSTRSYSSSLHMLFKNPSCVTTITVYFVCSVELWALGWAPVNFSDVIHFWMPWSAGTRQILKNKKLNTGLGYWDCRNQGWQCLLFSVHLVWHSRALCAWTKNLLMICMLQYLEGLSNGKLLACCLFWDPG